MDVASMEVVVAVVGMVLLGCVGFRTFWSCEVSA